MEMTALLPFLAIIALATYVQTVTGFALGMITMGAVTALDLVPIAFTSVIISAVTFINALVAIKGNIQDIEIRRVAYTCIGLFPGVLVGLLLLNYLSEELNFLLQTLLGATIIGAGMMIMLKPEPLDKPSSGPAFATSGGVAGVMAGMFSLAGPPLVYLFYRQPFELKTIRLCLISIFLVSSVVRTMMVGAQGGLTLDMLTCSLIAIPVVTLFTWLGKQHPPKLSNNNMRRGAFFLLIVIGISLVAKNLPHLF